MIKCGFMSKVRRKLGILQEPVNGAQGCEQYSSLQSSVSDAVVLWTLIVVGLVWFPWFCTFAVSLLLVLNSYLRSHNKQWSHSIINYIQSFFLSLLWRTSTLLTGSSAWRTLILCENVKTSVQFSVQSSFCQTFLWFLTQQITLLFLPDIQSGNYQARIWLIPLLNYGSMHL